MTTARRFGGDVGLNVLSFVPCACCPQIVKRVRIRRGKLNSQFIVSARIDLSIFTKNFKFQSLLRIVLAIEGVVQERCDHMAERWYLSELPATTAA